MDLSFIFQEKYIQNSDITELSHILEKVHSEPCHNGNFLYFQKRSFAGWVMVSEGGWRYISGEWGWVDNFYGSMGLGWGTYFA